MPSAHILVDHIIHEPPSPLVIITPAVKSSPGLNFASLSGRNEVTGSHTDVPCCILCYTSAIYPCAIKTITNRVSMGEKSLSV